MAKDAIEGYLELLAERGSPAAAASADRARHRRRVSGRLPSVRPRQLVRVLEQKGWRLARSKGSHHHFAHADSPNIVAVAVHAKDVKRGTLSGILPTPESPETSFSNG